MALYFYQAFSKTGKKVRGTIDASSLQGAREQLTKMGVFPTKIAPATSETSRTGFSLRSLLSRGVSTKDKIFFTKQLSMLLKSGVPLLDALELLVEQSDGRLKNIVISLKDGIKEGKSLADGLSKYPNVFENIYIQLVRAGEASGKLEIILDRLTAYLERQQALRKKIKGVLTYPLIQLVIVSLVVVGLLTFVVPQIAQAYESQGADLPLPTAITIAISNVIRGYYILILIAFVILYVVYRIWKATPQGARMLDLIKLHLPLVKYFARMNAVVQFSRTLGMLIESGVNLAEALSIVVKIVDNRVLVDALNEARENIIKQGRVAEYLKQTGIFPPVAIYLINTGEQSGHLDTMLITVAEIYETELNELADSMASKLEPALLVFMAVIVGFIVLSVMAPIIGFGRTLGV